MKSKGSREKTQFRPWNSNSQRAANDPVSPLVFKQFKIHTVSCSIPGLEGREYRYRVLGSNSSRGESIWHTSYSMAGLEVAVLQAKGVQFLQAGVDLLMHGGILGGNLGEFIDQTSANLVVVTLGVLETLAILGRGLGSLGGTSLGVDRASALHSRGRGGTRDPSSLAVRRG
jgi:hypothetical protein